MREVVYITGIPCSGKSTTAQRVSASMNLHPIVLDQMCLSVAKEIGCPDPRKLSLPSFWANVPNARTVKKRAYEKLFACEGCEGDVVVEGSALLYKDVRSIIDEIIGEHNRVFFLIDVSYETWLDLWESRYVQGLDSRPKPPSADAYGAYLYAKGLFQLPKHYWTVAHPQEIRAFGYRPYQMGGWRDDFTAKKWEGLHLPSLKGKTLLDLACNSGVMCQQALGEGASRTLGVDYNFRYLKDAHRAGVETVFLDLAHISRIKDEFDYVLLLSALHYIRDPERLIEEIAGLTKELFVWEGPVSQKEGLVLEFREGRPYNNYIPTVALLERWLGNNFARVVQVGPSVSPDASTRVVYHCWKEGGANQWMTMSDTGSGGWLLREANMTDWQTVRYDPTHEEKIDPQILCLCDALNEAGFETISSCCGHGAWPSVFMNDKTPDKRYENLARFLLKNSPLSPEGLSIYSPTMEKQILAVGHCWHLKLILWNVYCDTPHKEGMEVAVEAINHVTQQIRKFAENQKGKRK